MRFCLLHSMGLAALLALAGCATDAATPSVAPAQVPAPSPQAEDMARLQSQIGDAACSDDSQCRTLGWGAKACGGPERWIAWSTARSDGASLEALARSHAERQRSAQQRSGIASNCMVVPDPGAHCAANRCVLRDRNALVQ